MFNMTRQRVFIALLLMGFLCFGSVAAEARDNDTNGSDRLVKGAAIGAAVGAVTQVVRGRTGGKELLKGAAVGGAAGAAVGAYSDYKQEKNAREDERRYRDNYRYRDGSYNRGSSRPAYRWQDDRAYSQRGRGRAVGHRHNGRCGHRR